MGEMKPWQAVLFVVTILVVGGSLVWIVFGGERVKFADKIYLLDVPTGELFYADVGGRNGVVIPAKHPDSLERTLVPVRLGEDGWEIGERYREAVTTMVERRDVEVNESINRSDWSVSGLEESSARKYVSPLAG